MQPTVKLSCNGSLKLQECRLSSLEALSLLPGGARKGLTDTVLRLLTLLPNTPSRRREPGRLHC